MVMIGRNLTAAAARIDAPKSTIRKAGQSWQERLWEIYEHLGSVHYGVGFKRNAATKVDYFVAEVPEDTEEPVPTENETAIALLNGIDNLTEIVAEFMVHLNVAGEGYLVGMEGEEATWDVWSTMEYNRASQPGSDDELSDDDVVIRLWRPSPYDHKLPDSPLRSVQQQCEQLLLLNEQVGAVAMSRLSAGILLVPSELSFTSNAEDPPDTGANIDGDPFMSEIIDIATLPITDSDSAARVAPAVIRGAAEYLDKIKHLTFGREIDKVFADMREELLRQIAAGLDLPAEVLTGLADLNHWSLWGIDESTAKMHVDPDVLFILDGLTHGYLRPMLIEGGMSPDDARRFLIWRDYTDLTSRPLSVDQAKSLFQDNIIDASEVRKLANIPDNTDPIGPGDIAKRSEAVGVLFRAGFEPQAVLAALGLPSIEHTGAAPVTVQSEDAIESAPGNQAPAGPDNVQPGPPVTAAAGIYLGDLAEIDRSLVLRISEAAEAAFTRALEKAGSRVRAKAKKDRDLTAMLTAVDNVDITRRIGERRIERLQLTADQLIPADTFNPLAERLTKLFRVSSDEIRTRISEIVSSEITQAPEEEIDRDDAVAFFIAALLSLATQRLFTDDPDLDPAETGEISDSLAPSGLIYQTLTIAGGGGTEFDPDSPRGLALGQRTRAILVDHGYITTTKTWVYGDPGLRRTNFEPHRNLAGKVDPQVPGPAWLPGPFMFPGDHKGCACQLVPTIELDEGVT